MFWRKPDYPNDSCSKKIGRTKNVLRMPVDSVPITLLYAQWSGPMNLIVSNDSLSICRFFGFPDSKQCHVPHLIHEFPQAVRHFRNILLCCLGRIIDRISDPKACKIYLHSPIWRVEEVREAF